MNILEGLKIVDLALYFNSTLVIADVHIGYEETLNKQGMMIPRLQFGEMVKRIEKIFKMLGGEKIAKIVIAGDLKHEFGTISEQEWRNTLKFLDMVAKHCSEIIIVRGNHDTILGPIARKRNVKIVDYCILDGGKGRKGKVLIAHGDRVLEKKVIEQADTMIIGHEHPAISLSEGARVEQFKCFLKGKFKGKNLIVLPSFNTVVEGTDLLRDEILSPYLHQGIGDFEVFVVEDSVYDFGKLKSIGR